MSMYSSYLKRQIGYADLNSLDPSDNIGLIKGTKISGNPTVSISTDHRSLGQVVTLDGNNNVVSDVFSSSELHKKSKEALNDLKKLFNKG